MLTIKCSCGSEDFKWFIQKHEWTFGKGTYHRTPSLKCEGCGRKYDLNMMFDKAKKGEGDINYIPKSNRK